MNINPKRAVVGVMIAAVAAIGGGVALTNSACACAPPKPEAKAWPVITGTPLVGDTLTSSNGTWVSSGNLVDFPVTSYGYQWQRCNSDGTGCSDISSATSSTYILATDDNGHRVRVSVTATNAGGSTSRTSLPSELVTSGDLFPLQVSTNGPTSGRYLETASGEPWLLTGDSPQSSFGQLSESDMTSFLADRANHGINALWEWLPCDGYGSFCNANATTYDGIQPFTGTLSSCGTTKPDCYDVTTENSTYWDRIAREVAQAKADGIEMFLNPLETGGCQSGQLFTTLGNNGNGTVSTTDNDYKFGQFLGTWATTNGLNNIVWQAGNDFNCWTQTAPNNNTLSMMNGIHNTDPTALQTLEGAIPNPVLDTYRGSVEPNGPPLGFGSNIGINSVYTYAPTYDGIRNSYAVDSIPVIMGEANYDGEQNGGVDGCSVIRNCRLQEWWTMTSGAAGQFYGCYCTTHLTHANYPDSIDTTALAQFGYQTTLLKSLKWWELVPDSSNTFVTSGYGSCPSSGSMTNNNCATTTKTTDNTLALSYCPKTCTITVQMNQMAGSVTARWYDPTNGEFTPISGSPFSNTGTHNFTSPGNNSEGVNNTDWVLVLEASESGNLITCDLNANTSNFVSQVAAATSGQTVCLANGNYGTWNGTGSNKVLTIAPQPNASPNLCFDLTNTSNLTIDGGHTNYDYNTPGINSPVATPVSASDSANCSDTLEPSSSNITLKRISFTECGNQFGPCLLVDGATPTTIENNIFHDYQACNSSGGICQGGYWNGIADNHLTRASIYYFPSGTNQAANLLRWNLFEDSPTDAIDVGNYGTFTGNDFINISSPSSDPRHTDVVQWSSSADNHMAVKGNFVNGCTQGLAAYDGTNNNTIEDNVVTNCDTPNIFVLATDNPASLASHNTILGGPMACGSKQASPVSVSNVQNNIFQNGIDWGGFICTLTTDQNNMSWPSYGLVHSASDFIGTPSFVGGSNPNTYAGYALATGSPGKNAGSDGQDVGARPSLYVRPEGLP